MKTGIKTLEPTDYNEVAFEMNQLEWLTKEFRAQTPKARIDAPDTIGHPHKMWEWARALYAIRNIYRERKDVSIIDVGAAFSLLGPALGYLGYDLVEAEVDGPCGVEREKINEFLRRSPGFEGKPINWIQAGFGSLHERCKAKGLYDVVMSISTIEHVSLDLEVLAWKEMADLTKPGGLLIVTMDCVPVSKKGYMYDDVRWTNYDMKMVKARVDELKSYGFSTLGNEDYEYHGNYINDYSFASIHMVKQ